MANQIAAPDVDAGGQVRASMPMSRSRSTGDSRRRRRPQHGRRSTATSSSTAPATSSASTGARSCASSRAHWITNFEPNYLAFIEFYDEDFPWRYTPAAPDWRNSRLRPWIALVVLEEDEFKEGRNVADKPLPVRSTSRRSRPVFPPADELWAWAHVHVNAPLAPNARVRLDGPMHARAAGSRALMRRTPTSRTRGWSARGSSSRHRLSRVPRSRAFESGRLAGLGLDPAPTTPPTRRCRHGARTRAARPELPVYHRWFFRTGTRRRLRVPRPAAEAAAGRRRVGQRDMDVQRPGSNIPGIADAELHGVLRLGGALKVPRRRVDRRAGAARRQSYEDWDSPSRTPFQRRWPRWSTCADDYAA